MQLIFGFDEYDGHFSQACLPKCPSVKWYPRLPFLNLAKLILGPDHFKEGLVQQISEDGAPWIYAIDLTGSSQDWWHGDPDDHTCECFLDRIPHETIRRLRAPNSFILLDFSTEGRSGRTWPVTALHHRMSKCGLDHSRTIFLNANIDSTHQYSDWADREQHQHRFHVLSYHWSALMASWTAPPFSAPAEGLRPHRFLCFNHRPATHRLALALLLHAAGFRQTGLLSFLTAPNRITGAHLQAAFDMLPSKLLAHLPEIKTLASEFVSSLPWTVDCNPRHLRTDPISGPFPAWPFASSYLSLVTESDFNKGQTRRFTEKTWNAIIHLHPFVLVGNPGLLAELKALGFETFHPLIREDYDEAYDDKERMSAICCEVLRLISRDTTEVHRWYCALMPRLSHNREWLQRQPVHLMRRAVEDVFRIVNRI
jgi:hypothetical protein